MCFEMRCKNHKSFRRKKLGRRAVSNVISTMILVGAVVVLGLVTLAWSYGKASDYIKNYSETIDRNIAKIKERLAFEYIFYDGDKTIKIFLLNCGAVDGVGIQYCIVKGGSDEWVFYNPTITYLSGTPAQSLNVGEEGYITITLSGKLTPGVYYHVKIVTVRGCEFESGFVA
jgi:hypothetical protein